MGFRNRFLFQRSAELETKSKEAPVPQSKQQSIIVADSDPSELDHLENLLGQLGYGVLKSSDGETALRLARQKHPSLVMASLNLEKLDGYKLFQRLRDEKGAEEIPFMFICPPGKNPDRLIGHETHAHDYIQRPVSLEELQRRINSLLKPARKPPAEILSVPPPKRSKPTLAESITEVDVKTETPELPIEEDDLAQDLPEWRVKIYREAELYVLASLRRAVAGEPPDIDKGLRIGGRMIDSIASGPELLLAATGRDATFRITAHCVNVAVLALKIAATLGCDRPKLERIGLAALSHDLGSVRVPRELFYRTGSLNPDEIQRMKMRPVYSGEALAEIGTEYGWLKEIVEQVYERESGQGFPKGLRGSEIHEEAKIIGIADVFEAATHYRPYRKWITGYDALFQLTTEGATAFSDRIVKSLIRSFSVYPYNEYVILSSGAIGRVVDVNAENVFSPRVEILYDENGHRPGQPTVLDLSRNSPIYISKAITPEQLPTAL